jgi:hypothetical protein
MNTLAILVALVLVVFGIILLFYKEKPKGRHLLGTYLILIAGLSFGAIITSAEKEKETYNSRDFELYTDIKEVRLNNIVISIDTIYSIVPKEKLLCQEN